MRAGFEVLMEGTSILPLSLQRYWIPPLPTSCPVEVVISLRLLHFQVHTLNLLADGLVREVQVMKVQEGTG